MPLTSQSDVFVGVSEDAVNRISRQISRQNPALFNYGTPNFVQDPSRLCTSIDSVPGVPLLTQMQPFILSGTSPAQSLNFCFQLKNLQVDFYPGGNVFALPPELHLTPHRLAAHAQVYGGVELAGPAAPVTCFNLHVFMILGFDIHRDTNGDDVLQLVYEGSEFVDIEPANLETIAEGIINLLITFAVANKVRVIVSKALPVGTLAMLRLVKATGPTPNPQIEDDELKLFLDAEVH